MTTSNSKLQLIVLILVVVILAVATILFVIDRLASSKTSLPDQTKAAHSLNKPEPASVRSTGENQQELPNEIAATINEEIITWQAWQQATRLDAVMSQLTNQPIPTTEETLDRLISEIIILAEATEPPAPSPQEIEIRIAALESSWEMADEMVTSKLEEAGLTRADLIARVGRLMQVEEALNQLAAQEDDLNTWLTEARASAKIGLYHSMASSTATQSDAPLEETNGPLESPDRESVVESAMTTQGEAGGTAPLADMPVAPYPANAAPDFTLAQLNGSSLTLSDFRGKPTVINFWASWCPPCRNELTALQTIYDTYGDQIGFMAVDVKESSETVTTFIKEMGLTFPVVLDIDGQISHATYQVRGIPTTIFIDANGIVAARHVGPLDEATIDDYLAPLLAEVEEEVEAPHLAPDFDLMAASGNPISLQDYRNKSNVVLVFYRGQTWGSSRDQIVDLQSQYQVFKERNTEIIALAVQDVANAERMAQVTGASFPILADPDHAVADAYGVYNLLGDGVAAPAVFVIDASGQIVWLYVGQSINGRPDSSTILANLPP